LPAFSSAAFDPYQFIKMLPEWDNVEFDRDE
jgi:hypothetical protein